MQLLGQGKGTFLMLWYKSSGSYLKKWCSIDLRAFEHWKTLNFTHEDHISMFCFAVLWLFMTQKSLVRHLLCICICPWLHCFFTFCPFFSLQVLVNFLLIPMYSSWNNINLSHFASNSLQFLIFLLIFNIQFKYENTLIIFFIISSIAFMLWEYFPIHRSNIHYNVFLDILCSLLTYYTHWTAVYLCSVSKLTF